jgi:O-antigen/teichoic acid export membrane protein
VTDTRDPSLGGSADQLALGTAFVLTGQVAFVVSGYLLHFYLSRAIDPVPYGTYGLIMNVLTWAESALNSGLPWAVRKFLPADPQASDAILGTGLRWQLLFALVLFAVAIAAVPWFSAAIGDSSLAFYLRLAFADMLLMALYTFYRAALNGMRFFAAQGASMVAYAAVKVASSLLLVQLGYSVTGAIVGNAIGTLAGWLAAFWLLQRVTGSTLTSIAKQGKSTSRPYSGRAMLAFALPTVLFTLTTSFRTTVGAVGVKALVGDGLQLAYYTAANYLAMAPTVLLVAFSFTLFPHLAGSIAFHDWPLTRTYIQSAVRLLALVLIPGIAITLGTSVQVMTILYPRHYIAAAPLLNLLLVSTGLHSLYMIFANAILAEGRVILALSASCALVPISLLATWYLTGQWGPSGAAVAAVLTSAAAVLAAGAYVLRRFQVRLPWRPLGRIAVASAVIYAVTRLYVPRGVLLAPYYVALGLAYVMLLVLLREIKAQDINRWRTHLSGAILRWRVSTRA